MSNKTDGYTPPGAQMDAIAAWKAKNGAHRARVKTLDAKVHSQKKRTAADAKKRQWMSDRDSLQREQDRCEADLRLMYSSHLDLELQEYYASLESARIQFAVSVDDRLRTTQAVVRTGPTADSAAASQELRGYLAAEGADLARRVADGGEPLQGDMRVTDLDAVFRDFEGRLAVLAAEANAGQGDTYETLSSALAFAREKAVERAGAPPPAQSALPDDVMSTVALLLKMADRGRNDSLRHGTNASLVERVCSSYPQLSRSEAKQAVEDATAWRTYVQSCRAAAVDYRKAAASILALYETTVTTEARVEAMAEDKARTAAADEQRQEQLHAKAEVQRQRYAVQVDARAAQERVVQEAEAARLAKIKEQRMREMQKRVDCLAVYLRKQRELAEEEARQEMLSQAHQEAERQERLRYNGERVAFRQDEYADRQEAKRQRAAEVDRLRAEKDAALERFFRAVDERIGVEANPDRILLATVASSQVSKDPASTGAAFAVAHGYSDEQIMSDPRVKLYAALLEAGLHKTEYGREVATRGFRVSPAQQASETNPFRGGY